MLALDSDCLVNIQWVCHTLEMVKKKRKKTIGKIKTIAVREWAPGQPFDSPEKRPANAAKKVKI